MRRMGERVERRGTWVELSAAVRACERLAYKHESKGEVEESLVWLAMADELMAELVGKKES